MKELIWYSIPGAIFQSILALYIYKHCPLEKDINQVAFLFTAPIVGFIIHQTARLLFEGILGYNSTIRYVIKDIKKAYNLENNNKAFLIWELTFYGKDVPESFREHNRGTWHYIMSFIACWLASLSAIWFCYSFNVSNNWRIYLALTMIFLIFLIKMFQTYKSLNEQERYYFEKRKCEFDKFI